MKRLISSQLGAVMVMSAFFAIFLVAVLYHVVGVGGAALEQQIMQDCADATVFSAATANARGMNIIVLLNLLMVAAMTVLVALRLIEALLTIAVAIFTVLCVIPYTSYIGCPVEPGLEVAKEEISAITDVVDEIIGPLLEGLTSAADAVNQVIPYLAEAEGIYVSAQDVYNPSEIGFVWPVFDELPTMEGEFKTICERAGVRVGELIFYFLPMSGEAKAKMSELVGTLVSTFSDYFCGGDDTEGGGGSEDSGEGSSTKSFGDKKITKTYPAGDEDDRTCAPSTEAKETCDTCPSGDGNCENNGDMESATCDCGTNAACHGCSTKGCDYCWGIREQIENGLWTIRQDRWKEYWEEDAQTGVGSWYFKAWIEQDRRWLKQQDGNPCRNAAVMGDCNAGSSFTPRDTEVLQEGDDPPSHPKAVCIFDKAEANFTDSSGTRTREMMRTSYLYMHSCEQSVTEEIVTNGKPVEDNGEKYPRELDPEAYPSTSKMRSVVIGGGGSSKRMKGVNLAAKEKKDGAWGQRFSVAAAEYYSPNNDMWHLNWTARLIRFRMSYDDADGEQSGGGDSGDGASGNAGGSGDGFLDCGTTEFGECGKIQGIMGSSGEDFAGNLESEEGLSELGSSSEGGGFDVENLIAH